MPEAETIPPELEAIVQRELEAGERIRWIGQPVPRFFTGASTGAFLFAIPWTAFAIFWICGASGFRIPDFSKGVSYFALFGLPFVLIGFAMLSSPLWTYRKTRRTVYVITDRRAITIEGGWTTTIRSYSPDTLTSIFRKERRNGTGDVVFAQRWPGTEGNPSQTTDLGFLNIRDPRSVEALIRKLAAGGH